MAARGLQPLIALSFLFVVSLNAQFPSEVPLLTPVDAKGDANFGFSLSVHGDSMAVGAPGDSSVTFGAGAVFMFDYVSGEWSERSKLIDSGANNDDKFGHSVSLYEDTLAVGAVNKIRISGNVQLQAGAVFVFRRSGNAWTVSQQLMANDGQSYDHMGISVSLYQNALLIGAADDNLDAETSAGSVYLFSRTSDGSSFLQMENIHSADADDGDKFGFAVDLCESTAAVGAYQDDDQGSRSGSVYIYSVSGSAFAFQQKITAFDGDGGNNALDAFGFSLSLRGNTLAVSSFFDDDSGSDSGSVYIYTRSSSASLWSAHSKLFNPDVGTSGAFGYSVDLDVEEIAVGAVGHDSGAGVAYVYQRPGDGESEWRLQETIFEGSERGGSATSLGYAVEKDGRHIAVSAPDYDNEGNLDAGAVYYVLYVDSPTAEPTLSMRPSAQPSGNPSVAPSTSPPTRGPVTAPPSAKPSPLPTPFPSCTPTTSPTTPNEDLQPSSSGGSNISETIYCIMIILAAICPVAVVFTLIFWKKKCRGVADISPVVAQAELVAHQDVEMAPRSPATHMVSVIAVEPATESPTAGKVKKKARGQGINDGMLPCATQVGDYVEIAEGDSPL